MAEKNIVKRFLNGIDLGLIIALVLLTIIGALAVYSASFNYGTSYKYMFTQGSAFFIGIVLMVLIANFNYQHFKQLDKAVYIFSLLLLVSVLIFGDTVNGAKRWINFGLFSFQPVEIAKILYILVIASFLDKNWKNVRKPSIIIPTLVLLMGHFVLIMMQPAFSSTLSYFLVTLVLLYVAGVRSFYIFAVGLFFAISIGIPVLVEFIKLQPVFTEPASGIAAFIGSLSVEPMGFLYIALAVIGLMFFVWWFLWKLKIKIGIIYPVFLSAMILLGCLTSIAVENTLKEYQRKRVVVYLYPEKDSRGVGYNVIQSKIAIGSGKLTGKGFLKGTQTQLGFLPEQHTDFIFSVIGEEGGWLISQLTILFYFIFVWRALVIARESRDRYGSYVAIGIASMFTFYAVINIAMVTGLMPVAGVPLLFLSYGGSSMVSSLIAVGVLSSIYMRRHTNY